MWGSLRAFGCHSQDIQGYDGQMHGHKAVIDKCAAIQWFFAFTFSQEIQKS